MVLELVAGHAAEGDDGREAREVEEDERGDALRVQRVRQVAHGPWQPSAHVADQPVERPA